MRGRGPSAAAYCSCISTGIGQTSEISIAAPNAFLSLLVSNSFLLLVVTPGAPSSVLARSSDALCSY